MSRSHIYSLICILTLLLYPGGSVRAQGGETLVTFTPLGVLPGGVNGCEGIALSADGKVVVGQSDSATGWQAFRWVSGTLAALGGLPGGVHSAAWNVSQDGKVIVGYGDVPAGTTGFRWENGTMTALGHLTGGAYGYANAVSADGKVVVGHSDSSGGWRAFRWENGTLIGLGVLPGGSFSYAYAVSADGKVIAGDSGSSSGWRAFRWESGVLTGLGILPGRVASSAAAISADGSVIVGNSSSAEGLAEAFRWRSGVITGLGDLPGGVVSSKARGVSRDGKVIVGTGTSATGEEAFLWRSDLGMVNLKEFALAQGAAGLQGWTLVTAKALSADSSVLLGNGIGPSGRSEAFLLRTTNPGGFETLGGVPRTVSGRVALQGLAATAPARAITFEFRPQSGSSAGAQTLTFTRQIGGGNTPQSFAFSVPPGRYTLAVKGALYLRQAVSVDAEGIATGVSLSDLTLPVGDINNDNRVNLTDLVQLRADYGKSGTVQGDLTGDSKVNLTDLVLLRSNYGKSGAP